MKKILIIFLLFFTSPSLAIIVSDFSNMCGTSNYNKFQAVFGKDCPSGYYLPAMSDTCIICPYGYTCPGGIYGYNQSNDQGISIGVYTCQSGYFLPANAVACASCPTGYSCSGGTYQFNSTKHQGATLNGEYFSSNITNACATNGGHKFVAVFVYNAVSNCNAGEYLPAGIDECTECPANSACVGGTYSFNETINQGIEPCATGYSSDAGATSCTPNTIFITWDHADSTDITANNAGSVTYGGDIRTPKRAQHINGKIFTGWTFNVPQ